MLFAAYLFCQYIYLSGTELARKAIAGNRFREYFTRNFTTLPYSWEITPRNYRVRQATCAELSRHHVFACCQSQMSLQSLVKSGLKSLEFRSQVSSRCIKKKKKCGMRFRRLCKETRDRALPRMTASCHNPFLDIICENDGRSWSG